MSCDCTLMKLWTAAEIEVLEEMCQVPVNGTPAYIHKHILLAVWWFLYCYFEGIIWKIGPKTPNWKDYQCWYNNKFFGFMEEIPLLGRPFIINPSPKKMFVKYPVSLAKTITTTSNHVWGKVVFSAQIETASDFINNKCCSQGTSKKATHRLCKCIFYLEGFCFYLKVPPEKI